MDSTSSNDDEEPKVCTVFSSTASTNESKTIFDTIAFSVSKKESHPSSPSSMSSTMSKSMSMSLDGAEGEGSTTTIGRPISQDFLSPSTTTGVPKTSSMMSVLADDLQNEMTSTVSGNIFSEGQTPLPTSLSTTSTERPSEEPLSFSGVKSVQHKDRGDRPSTSNNDREDDSELPTAKSLFSDAPEVAFPVNIGLDVTTTQPPPHSLMSNAFIPTPAAGVHMPQVQSIQKQEVPLVQTMVTNLPTASTPIYNPVVTSSLTVPTYDNHNPSYDAWIPSEKAKVVLNAIVSQSQGTYIPDKENMTLPGVLHDEEFMDKVTVNMARIFGDVEASKRKTLSADNVTQDENGLRELIKLGCYRSALNLTKRLLTLCGQGPGKAGHYSKHTAHSLQIWFTRISLLVRIREFGIAEAEITHFHNFENPDMFYEYYPDSLISTDGDGVQRHGSLVPFNFRLLAAEIPQYSRKFNETMEKLTKLLLTTNTIVKNLEHGLNEDGSVRGDGGRNEGGIEIWKRRRIQLLYSLANSSLFSKQYHNAFLFLTRLCDLDMIHRPQLKSAIGRLFLQHGDLPSAQEYFQQASELRNMISESDQVESLVDSALILITQNSYSEALSLLSQASQIQPDNFMVLNNMAVCLLYLGRVKESVGLMETTVRQNIPQSLQENVLLNLSSIYELENTDGSKKNMLLKLISEYRGDGVNLASLKLPNLI